MTTETGGGASNETTILATLKDNTAEGIKKLTDRLKGVREDAEKAGKAIADTGTKGRPAIEQTYQAFERMGKVVTLTAVGVKGIEGLVTGARSAFKYLSGDVSGAKDEFQKFLDVLDRGIKTIPTFGTAISALGDEINDPLDQFARKAGNKLAVAFRDRFMPGRQLVLNDERSRSDIRAEAARQDQSTAAARARNERDLKTVDAAYGQFGSRFSLSDIDQQLAKLRDQREQLVQEMAQSSLVRDAAGHTTDAGAKFERSLLQLDKDIELLKQQRQHAADQQKTLLDIERAKLVDDHGGDLQALNDLAEKQRQEREQYVKQFGGKGVEELDQRQALEKVNLQISQSADRASAAESKLNEKLAQNADLLSTGSISIWEADRRNAEAQKVYEAEIEKTRLALMDMMAVATDPAIQAGIQKQLDALPPHVATVQKELNKLGGEIRDSLQQPMEGMFKGIITGTVSAKQAFKSMVAGFADNLASLAANKLATAILGGGGTGAGGGLGGLIGGFFTAKNDGGWIPGSLASPDRDSVPAVLTPGEYVVRRRAAQAAPRLLHAINSGRISDRVLGMASSTGLAHYNVGGFVQPGGGSGGAGGAGGNGVGMIAGFVMTPAEARKVVAAGKEAIFELLQQHPERIPRTA